MLKPDYKNSIVNLVGSVQAACGVSHPPYAPLETLLPEELTQKKNIILLLLDGLGYSYLTKKGEGSFLHSHLRTQMTSVFPTTTSAAISSLATGVAPMQHGVTGWFMYLHQLAAVTAVLPFNSRVGGMSFAEAGLNINDVIGLHSFYPQLNRKTCIVNQAWLVDTPYSQMITQSCETFGYKSFDHCLDILQQLATEDSEEKFVYAYWSEFDHLSHIYGVGSGRTAKHFKEIDKSLRKFAEKISDSDTALIITADHGLVDVGEHSLVQVEEQKDMQNMLRLPLCGEPRAAYCYVRDGSRSDFIQYCTENFKEQFEVVSSEQLIDENYFGVGKAHAQLDQRVGDVTLISKGDYVIKDRLAGEKEFNQRGVHGGLSEDELFVPLIYLEL